MTFPSAEGGEMADDSIFEGLDPEVATVLNAARRTSPIEPDAGLLAAMTSAAAAGPLPLASTPRRKTMIGKLITVKALGLAGALALTGGVAAAATGTLPDPVQDPIAGVVDNVGINIPKSNHGAKVSDVARDKSDDGDDNHGSKVSETARDNHGHNKDDATTTTTVAGDENSGPGNNGRGNANGHDKNRVDDDDDDATTTTTVVDDNADSDGNGGDSGRNENSNRRNSNAENRGPNSDD